MNIKQNQKSSLNPSFEKLLKETLDKIYENRENISYSHLKVLERFANKKS